MKVPVFDMSVHIDNALQKIIIFSDKEIAFGRQEESATYNGLDIKELHTSQHLVSILKTVYSAITKRYCASKLEIGNVDLYFHCNILIGKWRIAYA